ncbi:MAG: hypothetical protein ACT4QC_06085 [Planctomycetaceae bacterium]
MPLGFSYRHKILVALAFIAALSTSNSCRLHAGTTLSLTGLNVTRPHAGGSTLVSLTGGPTNVNLGHGGAFLWRVSDVTGDPIDFADVPAPYSGTGDIVTFCLQLTETFGFGTKYTDVVAVTDLSTAPDGPTGFSLGSVASAMIKWLWDKHFDEIFTQTTAALRNGYAGAFQLALWELEYDKPTTAATNYFTTGDLRATGNQNVGSTTLFALAKGWISEAINDYNDHGDTAAVSLLALTKRRFQDQLVEYVRPTTPDVDPVPEPASMAIWLLVGSGLAFQGRRMRRVRPAAA